MAPLLVCCLLAAACDGDVINLGRSQGLTGGDAGAGASTTGGAGSPNAGGKTWDLQTQPIVMQIDGILLANPTLTRDMSQLFFTEQPRFGSDTRTAVHRATISGSAYVGDAPVELGKLATFDAASPAISGDGKSLWLGLNKLAPEGMGGTDIWLSTGQGTSFSTPELVTELSSTADDAPRPPALGGTVMPLSSKRHGGKYYQVYLAARASADAPWGEPSQELLGAVNSNDFQSADGFLAAEGRELYFASNPSGQSDLYVARRASTTEAFGSPELVPDLNSLSSEDRMPWLSEDGRYLFFASNRSGEYALYRASR